MDYEEPAPVVEDEGREKEGGDEKGRVGQREERDGCYQKGGESNKKGGPNSFRACEEC